MAFKSDDDYWFSSEKIAFNFEDECSIDASIDKSSNYTRKEVNMALGSDFSTNRKNSVPPVTSVISSLCLERLLDDDYGNQKFSNMSDTIVQQTISNMILNRPYSLENIKSLDSKTRLLDAAVNTWNGDAILSVLLFLEKSLKNNIFFEILTTRRMALVHYINYLTVKVNVNKLIELHQQLVLSDETSTVARIKICRIALSTFKDAPSLLHKKLQNLYNNRYIIENDSSVVKKYMDFLDWQIHLQKEEKSIKDCTNLSVNECLKVSCQYFSNKPETNNYSPQNLCRLQHITDRQHHWMFLDVKISLQAWDDISNFFIKNNWFGTKRVINSTLNADNIISLLGQKNAPTHVIESFLVLVENSDKALALATKLKCHKFIVNYYITQKDKISLLNYKCNLNPQSEEYFLLEDALTSTNIKWRK